MGRIGRAHSRGTMRATEATGAGHGPPPLLAVAASADLARPAPPVRAGAVPRANAAALHGSVRVDWAACFCNLCHLASLRLDTCFGVDVILAAMRAHCCTVMRSLHIRSSQLIDPADWQHGAAASEWALQGSLLPSEHALRQLASSLHPDCALELQLDPLIRPRFQTAVSFRPPPL